MTAIGRKDLIGPDYANNNHRVTHREVIEEAISSWTSQHTPEEICEVMEMTKVPYGKIMNVKDLVECEHLKERGMLEEVYVEGKLQEDGSRQRGWNVKVPGVSPRLEGGGARFASAGPNLGAHNEEIFSKQLGLGEEEINGLRADGIIS